LGPDLVRAGHMDEDTAVEALTRPQPFDFQDVILEFLLRDEIAERLALADNRLFLDAPDVFRLDVLELVVVLGLGIHEDLPAIEVLAVEQGDRLALVRLLVLGASRYAQ